MLSRMRRVLSNVFGSAEATGAGDVFQRGQRIVNDSLCSVVDPLKNSLYCP